MPIAGKVIKGSNLSLGQAVSRLRVWPRTCDTIHQRAAALAFFLAFCSIIVNFTHSCNGTDGPLNLHKWVWSSSSSIPPSMSANILSMSAFTYNTQMSADLSCLITPMEKWMWELFLCILVQLLPLSFIPSSHPPGHLSSFPLPLLSAEHLCVLTHCVTAYRCSFISKSAD